MSIYDRARDALDKATPGPWKRDGNKVWAGRWLAFKCESESLTTMDNLLLASLAPEAAAAVVRAAELADELEREAEKVAVEGKGECRTVRALTLAADAARIRAALEGAKE